jgi:hypothetical protein
MAKKRTGLDALREYEARSGRQTQSEAQTEGSSGGAWRSGLDALRQFEANGGGRNVKNGEFNPNYRTMTRAMYESAYERYKRAAEAQERYSRAADAVGSSQVGGYLMAMQQREPQGRAAKTIDHDQQSGYRRTREVKSAQVQPTIEHDQQSGYLRTLRMKGSAEYLTQSQEDPAWETVRQDQARGGKRTQYELQRQIEQLERARDYALSMQAGDPEGLPELRGAYEAVNAGRTKPMTLTEMDEALREMKVKKQNAATLANEAMTAQELERKKDAIYALAFYPEEWTPEQKQAARGILETQRGGSGIFGGMDRAPYAFAPYIEAVRSGDMDRADEWEQIYNMLYSRLFEKTTAVTEGFAEGLGLRSAEKVIGAATGAENPAWEAYMRSVQVAKAQNPALSAAGQIAGSLALMGGISKGVGAASGALIGKKAAQLGTLGRTALSMGQSALTFAAREAIQGAGAAATGEKTGGAYAQDILASGAGGAAGALVSGLISTNMADWLRKTGNSKPFWEFVRQSASAYAFSGTSVATSAMLGSEKKSANEIATELGTAFLFSLVSGYMNTMRETKMASAAVEQKYETISQQLDAIGKHLDGGRKFRTEEEFTQAVEDLRRTVQGLKADVQGTYYAGQQDFVNQMVAALDRIDYNLLSILPGADAGTAAASAASTAAAGTGGVAAAEAQKLMQEASAALAEGTQGVPPAPVQPGDAGGKGAAAAAQALTEGMTPEQTQKRIQDAFGTTAAEQAVQVPPAQPTMPVPPDVAAEAEAAQREANFQAYSRYAEERDARARDAEEVSQVRAQEYTEAINDAEADAADAAFEKLNKAEVSGALDAQARWQAEDARAERQFEVESREDTDRALSEAAQRYGYDERMTSVLLSGYSGAQSTQQYAEAVNAAYEYGKSGMSRTAAQRAAQGIDKALADEAWSAGKEIANGEKAGAARIDDGGKRNAGMDSGKQAGAVAGSAGGTAARSAAGRAVAERIGLENRVSAAGQPYLSGKDIGLSKGSAQRSFREAPQSTWTDGMKAAAGTLRGAGFTDVHFTVGSISVENQRAKVTRYADGVAAGNSVWVNATAKKWSVQQLADHEAFHRQVQDTPGLLDSVRAVLADELGDSGIRELAQRYAEAYEGCYDGAELDADIEEICADAYAGMDRFPEEKAKIIQKAAQRAQETQQEAEENGGTRGPPEKYSVDKRFSADVAEWYREGMPEGESFTLGSTGETMQGLGAIESDIYMNGDKISTILKEHPEMTIREIQKIPELLDDPILILKSKGAGKGGNSRLVLFGSINTQDGQPVLAVLDLRPKENGFVLSDMQKVNSAYAKENPASFVSQSDVLFADKKRTVPLLRRFGLTVTSRGLLRDGSIGSISYRGNGVNISGEKFSSVVQIADQAMNAKFSADDTTATPQENDKTALAYFGRTYKWSETGYVLLNGARLDFSGRHEGGSGGYRSVDHRDIIDALGEDYGGGDYTGGMVRFMQEGNIRISPESGGINLAVMPTKAQMDSLSDFISKERGEVILDIDDASGNTISSTEYPYGTHANKVLQDIRNYFNDGTLPEVSNAPSVSQFRYSVAESDAGAEGTTAFTMDSIPKKAQDYLRGVRGQTAAAIQQTLSMPFAARKEVLKPAIEEMMNEYLQTGRISQETVDRNFEESYRRGVEMDTEFYDEYKDVKTRLRDLKVTLSETDRADIADFNDFRRAAFGRLRIADEGGLPVDTAYNQMREMAPELFPASVTHPADQLMQMFEVSKRIERVQRSLDEFHGEEAEEFKRWAKNDYEASVENMLGSLRVARRYAEARMRQKQARAVPTTLDEVKGLYADLKKLRRTYERAASKNLLTAEDNNVLNRLLRGDLAPEDVQGMENAKGILAMYEAKADYDAAAAKIADWRRYQKAQRLATADAALKNADQAKDKAAGIQYSRETMTRNVRDIFPEADAEIINRTYFEPVRTASANANKLKNQLREQVKALDLSRKANKGDAVSEAHAVQLLGEAQDNIRYLEQHPRAQDRDGKTLNEWRQIVLDLWATSPGLDRAKIENAVETFRKIYDGLFEQMNDVRIRNGYEPINYRQGYFPHFQPGTTDGILGLMGKALGIDAEVSALPTTISGLTHTFKPGIAYFGNALERIGFDTAYDAVEGFDKYVEGAASVICYTDVIQNLRALAQQVRYRTSDEGLRERVDDVRARDDLTEHQKELEIKEIMDKGRFSLSNFAIELDEYTNLLANKKSKYDRGIESLAGRKVYNLLKSWENRVAANMVAVNPASWLTNFGVITQAGAQLKTTSVLKAMGQTLKGWTKDDGFVERSDFLVNRRGSDPLVRTWQQRASAVLSKPMDWIDTFSADTIVRARYMENIARGMSEEEAMREADDFAANVMADRSKGAMPTMFESRNPIFKMFTQFQLEVNNTFSYLFKDLPRDMRKKGMFALAYALFKFLIGGYIYNEVYEHFIGRRPMLDPLGIVNDTVGDLTGYELNNLVDAAMGGGLIKESEPESAIGTIRDMAVNVGQEAPFIGNLMGGGKLPFSSSMPNVKNILTALDSETATDEEKLAKVGKELINPAAYWLLPFGGGQVKKMWQGISALKRQGSYTADGRLQYPIYTDREGDKANAAWRTMLFGKSATPEAQAWVEAGFGALSEKATQTYEAMRAGGVDQRDSYELIKAMSKIKKTDDATAKELKMQLLLSFDIEDSGKVLYYYNMMANDEEREELDELMETGADMNAYLRYVGERSGGWTELYNAARTDPTNYAGLRQAAIAAAVEGGKTQKEAEGEIDSALRSQLKEDYKSGKADDQAVGAMLKMCFDADEHDVYWMLEEWNGGKDWKKYGKFFDAVEKGVTADTRKVAKYYMEHGVDKGTLSSQLTTYFKERWLAASGDEAARLKRAYISAYKAIGGDGDKARDNMIKWRQEANKKRRENK